MVFHFLTNGKVVNGDPSNNVGLQNMIGWSIVNQRMLHFACTVIFFFEPSKPEKFRSDVFAKKGYEKCKKALESFDKQAACQSDNNAIMKCDDFMDKRSVTNKVVKYNKEEIARYKICWTSYLEIVRFLIE